MDLGFIPHCLSAVFFILSLPISLQFGMTSDKADSIALYSGNQKHYPSAPSTLPWLFTINLVLAEQCHVTVHLTGIQSCCSPRLGSGNPLSS